MKINPFLPMIASLVLLISVAIVFAANEQDCTGTSANPCHVCDVTNMYVKIYDPSDELIGTEYLTYDSQSGTCDSEPGITETWKETIGSSYFSEDGKYKFTLYAQIADEDWEYSDNITLTVATFPITIHPGWNLISIPYKEIITIDDPCNAFSGSFYPWNSADREWGALSWSQISGGKAYWLRSQNGCTVNIVGVGTIETSNILPLKAGYNFVGTTSSAPYDISSIQGDCAIIHGPLYWDALTQEWISTTLIEPTKGYWIRVENDCQFS